MPEKKKNNKLIAILLVLITISIIVAVIIIAINRTKPEDSYFNPHKRGVAQEYYNDLMNLNEETYPQAPEEVVTLYLEGYRLFYGNMIADEKAIAPILRQQRLLLSEETLESNTLESQEETLKENLEKLKSQNVYIVDASTKPIIFNENTVDKGYIRVTLEDNYTTKYYMKYTVARNDKGFWKIIGWSRSNENFTE